MKVRLFLGFAIALSAAGCATTVAPPAGMQPGRFVLFDCDGQDFQARFNPEGNTVRVRSHAGSAELVSAGADVYSGEGYKLSLKGKDGIALEYAGKVLGKNCKRA